MNLVKNARLFLTSYKSVVEKAPLQIYHSAIIFSPANSFVRKLFLKSREFYSSLSRWVKALPVLENWDYSVQACKQKLEGHTGRVSTVAFGSDGLLASGSGDNTVRIWDPATCECKQKFEGHTEWISTVAFRSDGLLASGSYDNTVRIWDPATGECKQKLKGHTDLVLENWKLHSELSTFSDLQPSLYCLDEMEWVTQNNHHLLLLPEDRRPTIFVVKDNILAIGHQSGRLTFLKFSSGINSLKI